jgi:hypothetical protein
MNKRDLIKERHREQLFSLCTKNQIDSQLLTRLLAAEKDKHLLRKRADIKQSIRAEITNIIR